MNQVRYFILLLCSLAATQLSAQRQNVWVLKSYGLDFKTSPPTVVPMNAPHFSEGAASVCDDDGRLLFYTEGTFVFDRNDNLMPNGSNLARAFGSSSTSQGTVITPVPGQSHQYYVFSLTSVEYGENGGRLYYSKVDMTLNGGLGDVVATEKAIFLDSGLTEKLTAMVGTRCNIWVITKPRAASEFKSFEVTASGVRPDAVVSATGIINYNYQPLGGLTPSPDNKKILCCASHIGGGGIELYDFDQATGKLSNPKIITESLPFYSACFSPDQSKVYAMNYFMDTRIFQYDLSQPNPAATQLVLGECSAFDKINLAPDGKVYFKGLGNVIGVINYPNLAGAACGYDDSAIIFDKGIHGALPNALPFFFQDTADFIATDISGPCWGVDFTLQARIGGWDYTWNNAVPAPQLLIDTPGIYWVNYFTPSCQYHSDTFYVGFPDGVLPDIITGPSCANASNGIAYAFTYASDTVTYHYSWLDSTANILSVKDSLLLVPTGSYELKIATAHCDTTLTLKIPEIRYQVSFQSDSIICTGDNLQFQNTSDSHFTRFLWYFSANDSTEQYSPSYQYTTAGDYLVTLTGEGGGCSDTIHRAITVDSLFSGPFKMTTDSICAGENNRFELSVSSNTVRMLSWELGDGISISSGEQHIVHAYDRSGIMPVKLTTQFRVCPDNVSVDTVYVFAFPQVDLGADTGLCANGKAIELRNILPSSGSAYHYIWGNGDTSAITKAEHPGIYSLTVSNGLSRCSTTDSVAVNKDCYLNIPNAFTPDGDGINDYFFPRQSLSRQIRKFDMKIFNRFGQIIFQTDRSDGRGWDGQYNNLRQPAGAYVYLIDVSFANEQTEQYKGNVTLIR